VVITPLPLVFISPRGGARLYIVLFGWAMIFAKLAWDGITLASKLPGLLARGAEHADIVSRPIAAAAPSNRDGPETQGATAASPRKTFSLTFRTFATALVACGLAVFTGWQNQRLGADRAFLDSSQKTLHVIQAFRSLNSPPPPGSTILLRP